MNQMLAQNLGTSVSCLQTMVWLDLCVTSSACFQASYQASLGACEWAKLISGRKVLQTLFCQTGELTDDLSKLTDNISGHHPR